ncbi:MAG: hypothetical protein GXP62_13060, partial [Oligoflexia bacterium]|nr:hypothetical protein [Oligoflexia bacterium]
MLPRPFCLALLGLLLPSTAMALDAVVPPLVAKGVDPLVNLNLTSLVSSEADFLGVFDEVTQLDTAPAGLTASCLSSTSCLYKIAKAAGTDTVLAGQATLVGQDYQFKLVYYSVSKNRILHTKTFKLPNSPAEIADGMGGHVREVVTGSAPAAPDSTKLNGFQDVDLFADDDFETVAPTADDSSRRLQTPTNGDQQLDDLSFLDEEDDGGAAALATENAARRQ